MNDDRPTLIACGVLEREIRALVGARGWEVNCVFLEPSLHCRYAALGVALRSVLAARTADRIIVVYGECHPQIDEILSERGAVRVDAVNCLELLLGREAYREQLARGAYFLLEEWALRWDQAAAACFGTRRSELIREMIREDRSFVLGVRTPCSRDFSAQARMIAGQLGLPLLWLQTGLGPLERTLAGALSPSREVPSCRR